METVAGKKVDRANKNKPNERERAKAIMSAPAAPAKPVKQEVCPGIFLSTLRKDSPLRTSYCVYEWRVQRWCKAFAVHGC
jgi:hypothetical protein